MGWTSLFQADCIFQIANSPWLRPKVRRLKVRGSKVHVLNWCLLSFLAWYDTGPKVSGPEVLRFKVRASKLMFQFLCFYGLVLEWYSTKLSGPVVPRLKVLGPKYEIAKLSGSQIKSWVALSSLVVVVRSVSVKWAFVPIYIDFKHWCQYTMHVWWYLVVSGGVWSMSGSV